MSSPRTDRHAVDVYCQGPAASNAANEPEDNPVKIFPNVPGNLVALRGRELELAQQINANISWRFTCRQDGIKPDMWLCQQGNSRQLNVEAVLPDEREIDFQVLCSERVF